MVPPRRWQGENTQTKGKAVTEQNLIPEAATEEKAAAPKQATLPKTIADVQAITHVPTTEATRSFAAFINRYLTNADNFEGISEEQAWTVIGVHRVWQQSDERKAEIEALKASKAEEAEAKRKAREEAKAERERKAAAKAEEKARKEAEKAAKAAAEGGDDSDLESLEDVVADETAEGAETVEGDGEITEAKPRKRRARGSVAAGADGF